MFQGYSQGLQANGKQCLLIQGQSGHILGKLKGQHSKEVIKGQQEGVCAKGTPSVPWLWR